MRTIHLPHPNAKGNGTRLSLKLTPADGPSDGHITLAITPQDGSGFCEPCGESLETSGGIELSLGFIALAQLLQLFRGEVEAVSETNGGKPLTQHRPPSPVFSRQAYLATFEAKHILEPVVGYGLTFTSRPTNGSEVIEPSLPPYQLKFLLTNAEALALAETISQSLSAVAFGLPAFGIRIDRTDA